MLVSAHGSSELTMIPRSAKSKTARSMYCRLTFKPLEAESLKVVSEPMMRGGSHVVVVKTEHCRPNDICKCFGVLRGTSCLDGLVMQVGILPQRLPPNVAPKQC